MTNEIPTTQQIKIATLKDRLATLEQTVTEIREAHDRLMRNNADMPSVERTQIEVLTETALSTYADTKKKIEALIAKEEASTDGDA